MSNTTQTPNMNLIVPTVGQDPGPDWATNLNADLAILDSHNHSPGSGVQITPGGINFNADLPANNNNLTLTRSIRFQPQSATIAGASDLGCLYESGVDLYYNDGAGNQIRITQSGSVSGSSGTITGLPFGTASAAYSSGNGTFVFQQATSTGANLDIASLAIRYPGSYPTPSGNYIQIQAPSSLSGGYALTLPNSLPSAFSVLQMGTGGGLGYGYLDSTTLYNNGTTISVKPGGITSTQIAAATITGSNIAAATVTGSNIALSTIGGSNIGMGAVTGLNIQTNINLPGTGILVNSQYPVVATQSAAGYPKVMYGGLSSAGGSSGPGWSQTRASTGLYTVTFGGGDVFSAVPAVTITSTTSASAATIAYIVIGPTVSGFSYQIVAPNSLAARDANASFIAVGNN